MSTLELDFCAATVDSHGVDWRPCSLATANSLLAEYHYLGPIRQGRHVFGGFVGGAPVAAQVWKAPTARNLPADGTWLELARWCLTSNAGPDAGSRMHKRAVRSLRDALPMVTTLVSYSDPSHGHGGSLYRACNWLWAPTWHRLRPPPSGLGSWDGVTRQAVQALGCTRFQVGRQWASQQTRRLSGGHRERRRERCRPPEAHLR